MIPNNCKNIKRVFIANRGEIALRIIHACKSMGIQTVIGYSEPDEFSLPVRLSDFATPLGGKTSAESYLDINKMIKAIELTGADAVHPGYGFLSENAKFATAVIGLGVKFIGPNPNAIEQMGDKITAKSIMRKHNIPTVPGSECALDSADSVIKLARDIGFPLILKAAAGGGGRGMRIVNNENEIPAAFDACTREAASYFANPAVFAEKYIQSPRHIEFQVLFDQYGNGVHLFERDCSIQRRHQKLIEEAPSTFLDEKTREHLGSLALKAAQAVNYSGVGTVEFICESDSNTNRPKNTYFMEMNTRIQVEHPVTEMITGIDLIKEQIKVADGQKLTLKQEDIKWQGWSVECRINAEDPEKGFMPTPGRIKNLYLSRDPWMRIDTHIEEGYEIPPYYDSMIAKFISYGKTREEAITRMLSAFAQTKINGISTTINLHENILKHPKFKDGCFDTKFMEKYEDELIKYKEHNLDGDCPTQLITASFFQDSGDTTSMVIEENSLWQNKSRLDSTRNSI